MINKNWFIKLAPLCITVILLAFITSCKGQDPTNTAKNSTEISNTETDKSTTTKSLLPPANRKPLFTQVHSNLDGMVSEFVRKMYQDKRGNFWFGTNGDGIIRYNGLTLDKLSNNTDFEHTAVRGIVEDNAGNVWFGTSGGLYKYDSNSFTHFSEKDGLLNNEIWGLTLDKNGLLWIGTLDGACRFNGEEFSAFPIPQADIENPESMLSPKRISTIVKT